MADSELQDALKNIDKVDFGDLTPFFDEKYHPKARENRLYAAKHSFKCFMFIYMSHFLTIKPAPFQLKSYENAFESRLLEIWPRGFGKSRTWAVSYPLWVVLNNPFNLDLKHDEERIVLISRAGDLPEEWIAMHKEELTSNSRIIADYDPQPGDVWRVDQIKVSSVQGRGTIYSKGSGAQIRGHHPTEVIVDDLEDRLEAESAMMRDKVKRYFYRDLYMTLRREGKGKARMKIIGTPVHEMGLLPELYEKKWFKSYWYGARKDDGTPLWPEYMNDQDIERVRQELAGDPGAFETEILCKPTSMPDRIFQRETFQYFTEDDEDFKKDAAEGLYTVCFCDPATKRRHRRDHTAVVTISMTMHRSPTRFYVRARGIIHHKAGPAETIQRIADLYREFSHDTVGFEINGFQEVFADEWKRYCERNYWHPRLELVTAVRDKETRARAVTGPFVRRQVFFDTSDPLVKKLIDELSVFPTDQSADDLVDALVHGMAYLKKREHKASLTQTAPYIVLPGNRRDELTGVVY